MVKALHPKTFQLTSARSLALALSIPPGKLQRWPSLVALVLKNLRTLEMRVLSLGQEDPLEEEMATHSSILTWRIPWTEETKGYSPLTTESAGRRAHAHTSSAPAGPPLPAPPSAGPAPKQQSWETPLPEIIARASCGLLSIQENSEL